ncbi:MAG: hypothetical protein QOE11_3147 [Solirubrobacteraceae bacterium]|nr:hypothetical protein [Solirubrobacteraceae bacterium]
MTAGDANGDGDGPDGGTLLSLDFRLTAEELAVLCRGREEALALLLPELAGITPLDVVERSLIARELLELAPGAGARPVGFTEDLVRALCEPVSIEHVTIDELGGGPGSWLTIAHGDDIAVTVTPSEVVSVYDVSMSGPYAPATNGHGDQAEFETTLRRLEELLTARRADALASDPEDRATALVLGAATYVERVQRVLDGGTLAVEHRVLLDADDLGTWELLGVPSPVEGDEVDRDAAISWVRIDDDAGPG